jgi:hypothetical protein
MNKYRMSFIIGVFALLLFSCDQYAIFDAIAQEVKPKPALIKGKPSKIVGNDDKVYVANGELWEYTTATNKWNKVSGRTNVRDVAIVGTGAGTKYAAISVGNSPYLPGFDENIAIQGIFGAKDTFFAPVGVGASYSVYSYDGSNDPVPVSNVSGLLKGAAHYNPSSADNYYLATSAGLYHASDTSNFTLIQSGNFLGVIALSSSAVAVTESAVYEISGNTVTHEASIDSLTGAIAAFGNTLYLGRTRGYRIIRDTSSNWELATPSTETKYNSTIAQVHVHSMYAVSADLIFASVFSSDPKRSGLMSLRGGSWNMEE